MVIGVREEKPKSVKEGSEMADNYELDRKADLRLPKPATSSKSGPYHPAVSRVVEVQRSKTNFRAEIQCWECKKCGHMTVVCPDIRSAEEKAASKLVIVATQGLSKQLVLQDGKLDGKNVQVLLDTGSTARK